MVGPRKASRADSSRSWGALRSGHGRAHPAGSREVSLLGQAAAAMVRR